MRVFVPSVTVIMLTAWSINARHEGRIGAGPADGEGRCPSTVVDTSFFLRVEPKPDAKPRRANPNAELAVASGAYRLASPEDQFRNIVGHPRRVLVTAVIDTSGHAIPGSVTIAASTSRKLSWGVCEALLSIAFKPGKKAGVPVVALYSERLEFIGTSATTTDRGPEDQSSRR